MSDFHLVCVHPFHNYTKGQQITDSEEIAALSADREHHFVRIAAPVNGATVILAEADTETEVEAEPVAEPIKPAAEPIRAKAK